MMQPRKAIEKVISDFRKLHPTDKEITVAVSGGVDSAALLFCLFLAKAKIQPVFVFHGIRSESEEQKSYEAAQAACRKVCTPDLKSWKPLPLFQPVALKTENAARTFRYECLAASAGQDGVIATAHHADDQLETILMRLCRGSGITGLAAIPPFSKLPVPSHIDCQVIRPMLGITKNDCIEICYTNNIPWHEDITNCDTTITRNRLRTDVIPVLKELYPQCSRHASEAASKLRNVSQVIDSRVSLLKNEESYLESGIEINTSCLKKENDLVLAAYFRDVAKRLNNNTRIDKINNIIIEKLILSIREKKKNAFDWPGLKVNTSSSSVSFVVAGERSNA